MKEGYLLDYISGLEVKETPEELDAVQVFSKQLVEDYGYSQNVIQTRPQFRVKVRPSDIKKEYPIDIAVFKSQNKTDDDLYIIVECKKKNRSDGITQLKDYMRLSNAFLGVWFNGSERCFLHKVEANGMIKFEEIPNIPKFGESLDDIGKHKRKDLQTPHNLKPNFKSIRNYLAANTVGATRDEVLAQQLINIIFCKIYDEKFTSPEEMTTFRLGVNEESSVARKRIHSIFNKVKEEYKDIIDESDKIELDDNSVGYIVGELQNYCLMDAERDVIADAFEIFIGHALKGGQGQFFTPRNVIRMIIDILQPTSKDKVIDPACGSGGFLIESLRYIWNRSEIDANNLKWSNTILQREKMDAALNCMRGIDKDYFLSKVCKAYMAIIGDGKSGIFCEDSLENPNNWKEATKQKICLGEFDILITNPPFGSKIPVKGASKLGQYDLGHKWKLNKKDVKWEKGKRKDKEAPQILFIERCLQLLKEGGRMGIVLPDGCFGNESLSYLRNWLINKVRILGIIDLPLETFLPNTGTKTSVLICQKINEEMLNDDYPIFMCVADTCGHDRRGKEIESDDIKNVANEFKAWMKNNGISF